MAGRLWANQTRLTCLHLISQKFLISPPPMWMQPFLGNSFVCQILSKGQIILLSEIIQPPAKHVRAR